MLKNSENNVREETGLVTPIPDLCHHMVSLSHSELNQVKENK